VRSLLPSIPDLVREIDGKSLRTTVSDIGASTPERLADGKTASAKASGEGKMEPLASAIGAGVPLRAVVTENRHLNGVVPAN
jgi:hypothetical protein